MRSHQCRYFAAQVKRWNSNQLNGRRRRSPKRRTAPALALGAAVFMGSTLGWAEEAPGTLPGSTQPAFISTQPVVNTSTAPAAAPVNEADLSAHPEVLVTGERGYIRERVSASEYTEPLRDIPQTITVIPKEVMEDQGATTMRQVLRNVPGISMQAGEGGVPAGDNLSIRGFNARTDFYIDGMRDFGGYFRDPFNTEQVEVSKGPSSATGGRGATGGSINQVSKAPGLDPITDGSFGFGTDNYKRGTLDINRPIEDKDGTAVRVNAMWNEGDVPRRDEVDYERWGIAPYVTFGLGSPTRYTLGYFHLSQENMPDYGIPWVPETNTALIGHRGRPAPVNLNNFYGLTQRDYEKTVTDVVTGIATHDITDDMSIRNLTRIGETTRDSVITAPRFVSNSTTSINRQLQSRDQEDDILANQTDWTSRFKTGPIGHATVVGMEFARETQENFARSGPTAPTADLFNPLPSDPYPGPISRTGQVNKAIAESMGFYVFDTLKFGEKFEVPVGVRWDQFAVEFSSSQPSRPDTEFERTDRMLSGRAGLVFKPVEHGSIYAGYGTSFNPSAEGLTSSFTGTLSLLEPEKTRSYEVGTKWDVLDRQLSLNTALFRTEKTNARTPGLNPTDPPTVLQGEQRVDGVELGVTGSLTPNWQIFSGYTYMESEIEKSNTPAEVGKEISNAPKTSYNVWTSYQFPSRLSIGGGAQYVSKRFGNNTNTREVGSYILYDAMASLPINNDVTLRLNLNNLLNEEYFDSLGGGHLIPGAGRLATLTTDVKF